MRTWWRRAGTAIAGATAILLGPVPVARADDALVVEPGQVVVTNGAGQLWLVNPAAGPVGVTLGGGVALGHGAWPLTFTVDGHPGTSPIEVKGHGTVPVSITVGKDAPAGTSGVITVVTNPAGPAQHVPVSLSAGSPAGLVSSATTDLRGPVDLPVVPQRPVALSVPIAANTCPGRWSAPVILQSSTYSATVTATCSGPTATRLDLAGAAPPAYGTYTGTIKLGGSGVTVTVTTAAGWIWAIAVALIGLLGGLLQRGYLINHRPISRLVVSAKALARAGISADTAVKKADPTVAWAIAPGAAREANALAERAADVQRRYPGVFNLLGHPSDDDAAAVESITKDIAAVAAAIAEWRSRAATVLGALKSTVDGLAGLDELAPGLKDHADGALGPGSPAELETSEIQGFLADAEATAAALELLPTVSKLDAALQARAGSLSGYESWQSIWYAEARGLTDEVLDSLRTARTGTDVVAADLDHKLEQARQIALRLPDPTRPLPGGFEVATAVELVTAAPVPDGVPGLFDRFRARPAPTPDQLVRRTRITDRWLLLVAAVVAVWGGLTLWYVDKPWGTVLDLVAALLWGLGAGVVAGPLADAVERVTQNAADRRTEVRS
ncbi:hypothetical protein [Kutzneria buriramensis]|uniref:Uncharacterized protein n=1 Tax=Kutzneria buriramensis TaxID=1045776 RepID=A0A3E0HHK6_9PSEU|nr:hypothetical protein [Kutzneria buriramensis]REH45964.1 hypothetical protein BCF44_10796 [Kutzneria buriramensis]